MGRIQRIEGVINSTISHYSHVKVFPRGLPRFADSLLRGTVRFGKRTGNTISVLNPDNTFEFAVAPQTSDSRVVLTRATEWLTPGAIISLGPGKELHKIDDVIDEVILLEDPITRAYTVENDRFLIHSFPMLSSIDTPTGSTTLTVKSHYQIANGDVFAYLQTEELLQSLTEVKITKATRLGTTTDLFYTLLYNIELESPIQTDIISNSVVYLRAYPAYFSAQVRVPNALFTSEPIGPFLIDTLSGKLLEGKEFNETISFRTLNRTGGFVLGSVTTFETVEKNFLVMDRTIPAHTPIFWELAEGTMRISPSRVHFRVGDNLKFSAGLKAVPNLPADRSWRISLLANEDCSIRFIFSPHPFQEFTLLSGISQTVTVVIPAGVDATDIEINILAFSNTCEVQLTDWTPATDTVEQFQYNIVVEATGNATYQSTGLLVKPYFLGSEFLKGTYDVGDLYDGGKVYF